MGSIRDNFFLLACFRSSNLIILLLVFIPYNCNWQWYYQVPDSCHKKWCMPKIGHMYTKPVRYLQLICQKLVLLFGIKSNVMVFIRSIKDQLNVYYLHILHNITFPLFWQLSSQFLQNLMICDHIHVVTCTSTAEKSKQWFLWDFRWFKFIVIENC